MINLGKSGDRRVIDLMLAHIQGGIGGIYDEASTCPALAGLAEIYDKTLLGEE